MPAVGERIVCYHTDDNLPTASKASSAKGFLELLEETRRIKEKLDPKLYVIEAGKRTVSW